MHSRIQKSSGVHIITLGCSKNLVDSEQLSGQLESGGLSVSHEDQIPQGAAVVVNTCGFIESAKEESIETILKMSEARQRGDIAHLVVMGCLTERYAKELKEEIQYVDGWFGSQDLPEIVQSFGIDYRHELLGERKTSTASHFAYLKISEGCNRTCAFCAIPLMRGKHRSRPIDELVNEAKNLAAQGVKEVLLIGQELTYYGLDLEGKRLLPELLRQLAQVNGIRWIRLHYAYPSKFPLDVLDVIREEPTICNYLDIPLQHAADPVLHRMRRQITRAETTTLLNEIRQRVPGIALRTTMLVGFPGETEDDFNELCDFVREQRFHRLGVFTYSHEDGTHAGDGLEDDVPEEIKASRASRLMEIQQEISMAHNAAKIGQTLSVLVDRKEGAWFIGRTEFDSPEVDNEVLIDAERHFVRVGDLTTCRIVDATDFDLFAEPMKDEV